MKSQTLPFVVIVLLAVACGKAPSKVDSGIPADADIDMQASDFGCILKMTPLRGFYLTNKLGYLTQTLAVAYSKSGGKYPPGTLIQLVPNEAMVKRKVGWNADTHDWEFFALQPNGDGTTTIQARGGAEVVNHFGGGSCFDCHNLAKSFDLVCEMDHGCAPLSIGPEFIASAQQADVRCSQ